MIQKWLLNPDNELIANKFRKFGLSIPQISFEKLSK